MHSPVRATVGQQQRQSGTARQAGSCWESASTISYSLTSRQSQRGQPAPACGAAARTAALAPTNAASPASGQPARLRRLAAGWQAGRPHRHDAVLALDAEQGGEAQVLRKREVLSVIRGGTHRGWLRGACYGPRGGHRGAQWRHCGPAHLDRERRRPGQLQFIQSHRETFSQRERRPSNI